MTTLELELLLGFKWETLPQDALIVDVGGGVGSTALQIAKATPHVKIVVQDRASVIKDATIVSHKINVYGRIEIFITI